MAISNFVWFMIIVSIIVAIVSFIFFIIMIWNYFKRKTMGTALLTFFYGIIALYHVVHSIMMNFAAQNPFSLLYKIFYLLYVSLLVLSYYFLYTFACRHILRDNDIAKSIVNIIMLGINAVLIGVMGYELLVNVENYHFYVIDPKQQWDISHYVPATFVTIIIYLTCVLFVELRLILRLSIILAKKQTKSDIHRKGLQQILFGIIFLFISVLLSVIISIPNTKDFVFAPLYLLRGVVTLLGLYLSYIGWILPNWYVKRIRKAWIVSEITIGEKVEIPFINSENYKDYFDASEES
ncbi:MAG: hypothetical protein JXA54_01515 [Candidatus Heimdallarchaeota archaeon]|nr:hypothetical protein [Candidatus Heimdallarchaeota archaeon]